MTSSRFPSLLLVVIISCFRRGSASDECAGGDRSSVLVVPSSGPTVCLPYDDYIQLRQAGAGANSDGETTDVPTSASSTQSVASSALLLYRYMSPLWLQTHANFTETPSSVSAQNMDFTFGSTLYGVLFRVDLIEAGVLHDDKTYVVQLLVFLTYPSGVIDSDPIFQICDGSYCVGLWTSDQGDIRAYGGTDSVSHCVLGEQSGAINQASSNWNIRFEIHPNSTTGIAYVGTNSLTHEYNEKLTLSHGLHFKVCRHQSVEQFQFHLLELAMYLNE